MSKTAEAVWVGIAYAIGIAIAFFLIFSITGILFLLAWNLGVVGVAAACGAAITKIGFWTGFGGAVVLTFLKSVLGNDVKVNKNAS